MAKKIKTNEDLVVDLMNYSPYGALCQSFIITAIRSFSDKVISQKKELLEMEKNGEVQLVSMKAWVGIAEDIKKRMDEFYNR